MQSSFTNNHLLKPFQMYYEAVYSRTSAYIFVNYQFQVLAAMICHSYTHVLMMNISGSCTDIMTILVRKRTFETRCDGTSVL